MKRKETSVSSENWICSHQQPGANALWDYPNSLPQGCVGFHQASLLATLCIHTASLPLHTSYWSLNSLQLAVVIFYEASAIFYSMPMVWVIQKKSHAGGEEQAEHFSFERLRGPNHSAFCYILTQWCRCCLTLPSGLPGIFSQEKVEGIKYIWLGYKITDEGYHNAF